MIFRVIVESDGGLFHVSHVKKGLRGWYIDQFWLLAQKEPDNYELYRRIATVMFDFWFLDEAHQLYQVRSAAIFNNLALLYNGKGAHDVALEYHPCRWYHHGALTISLKRLGEIHPDVTDTLNNIVTYVAYVGKSGFDKAVEYYKQSLTIKLNTLGENHADLALTYNNIGNMYSDKGEQKNALEYYDKSLKIKVKYGHCEQWWRWLAG